MNKGNLIADFYEISKLYKQLSEKYRGNAFKTAATVLMYHQGPIPTGRSLREIDGIGESTAKCIEEWLQTGKIQRLIDLRVKIEENRKNRKLVITSPEQQEKDRVITLFKKIHGVGPKRAEIWYQKGWRSIEDLKKNQDQLTHAQRVGLGYLTDLDQKIPREEIDLFQSYLEKMLPNVKFLICGSYRRGAMESGDIDVLLMETEGYTLDHIVKGMAARHLITGDLALGPKKFMGTIRLTPEHKTRRLDLRWVSPEVWPFATLYFTGSGALNVQMRRKAISMGMSLSEYGLTYQDHREVKCQSEQEIFAALGMMYLPPNQRSIVE